MYFLENVPNFQGVMIHPGNTKKDTEGCILVGWNEKKGWVCRSAEAYSIVSSFLDGAKKSHLDLYININEPVRWHLKK